MNFYYVFYQSFFAFISLFIISKMLGKKQVAQLEFTDYVIGISIGSIAAEMAVEQQTPYWHFIIGMLAFGVLDILLSLISRKGKFLKKLLKGKPLVIIENGIINYKNLKKSKLDINELIAQCRVCGYFSLADINYCIFETSGDFSIMPKSENSPLQCADLNIEHPQKTLELSLIIDGKIIKNVLKQLNKSETWLLTKLKIKNKSALKNILVATFNQTDGTFSVFYKNNK